MKRILNKGSSRFGGKSGFVVKFVSVAAVWMSSLGGCECNEDSDDKKNDDKGKSSGSVSGFGLKMSDTNFIFGELTLAKKAVEDGKIKLAIVPKSKVTADGKVKKTDLVEIVTLEADVKKDKDKATLPPVRVSGLDFDKDGNIVRCALGALAGKDDKVFIVFAESEMKKDECVLKDYKDDKGDNKSYFKLEIKGVEADAKSVPKLTDFKFQNDLALNAKNEMLDFKNRELDVFSVGADGSIAIKEGEESKCGKSSASTGKDGEVAVLLASVVMKNLAAFKGLSIMDEEYSDSSKYKDDKAKEAAVGKKAEEIVNKLLKDYFEFAITGDDDVFEDDDTGRGVFVKDLALKVVEEVGYEDKADTKAGGATYNYKNGTLSFLIALNKPLAIGNCFTGGDAEKEFSIAIVEKTGKKVFGGSFNLVDSNLKNMKFNCMDAA